MEGGGTRSAHDPGLAGGTVSVQCGLSPGKGLRAHHTLCLLPFLLLLLLVVPCLQLQVTRLVQKENCDRGLGPWPLGTGIAVGVSVHLQSHVICVCVDSLANCLHTIVVIGMTLHPQRPTVCPPPPACSTSGERRPVLCQPCAGNDTLAPSKHCFPAQLQDPMPSSWALIFLWCLPPPVPQGLCVIHR